MVPSVEDIWMMIWRGAYYSGAKSAEDSTQEVICRFLASGKSLEAFQPDHPAAYWGSAGRREVIREWRQRHQFSGKGEPEFTLVALGDWLSSRVSPEDTEARALAHLELAGVPPRIAELVLRGRLTSSERQVLFKWRRKRRKEARNEHQP
jgi:hypothetical protein